MTPITKTVKGLAGIVIATRAICRLIAVYGDDIRPLLDVQEQAAFDQLQVACHDWNDMQPISAD